jgi:hypothetical protein
LRVEEGTEERCEGVERSAEGFEETPVGLFDGDSCDMLLTGVAGVEGFFLALSLAFTAGRATLGDGFR